MTLFEVNYFTIPSTVQYLYRKMHFEFGSSSPLQNPDEYVHMLHDFTTSNRQWEFKDLHAKSKLHDRNRDCDVTKNRRRALQKIWRE